MTSGLRLYKSFFNLFICNLFVFLEDTQITLRGDQYITFDIPETLKATRDVVTARFKTFQPSGLIMYVGEEPFQSGDFMQLALRDGAVYYSVNLGSGVGSVAIKPAGAVYNDGKWHEVVVVRDKQKVIKESNQIFENSFQTDRTMFNAWLFINSEFFIFAYGRLPGKVFGLLLTILSFVV